MRIRFPNLVTSNALTICEKLPRISDDKIFYFDVSNITNYEPLPMLLTAAAIRDFRNQRSLTSTDTQLRFKDNSDYQYACHMGFFQAAGFPQGKSPGEAPGSTSYIPLTKINIKELIDKSIDEGHFKDRGEIIELEAKRLSRVLSQGQREFQKLLQYLLREAIRNIPEHAETNDVWICGQYWQNRDEAEIAILDEGIGVYSSLSKNSVHRRYIDNNEEALRWALKPGVSASFNPSKGQRNEDVWANSGYGLFMISEICKLTRGWFTFVSGDNCVRVYPNNTAVCSTHYHGTALGIRVRPSKISNCDAIISQARYNGEETAKGIKTAFKSASTPSKGLMI